MKVTMTKTILVLGGGGYIGSITASLLAQYGYHVVVLDWRLDLHTIFVLAPQEIVRNITLLSGDYGDAGLLKDICTRYDIAGVIHLAGFIEVAQSVIDPQLYYENNVAKAIIAYKQLMAQGIKNIVFSSSAAVYGTPDNMPITEDSRCVPCSPYGMTKYCVELLLKDYIAAYGLHVYVMRYFNVAGAMPVWGLGERHEPETHLIPRIIQAAREHKRVTVFGHDYATPDGTCIRDYVHVLDIAQAHCLAMEKLLTKKTGYSEVVNLGTGSGYSVMSVIKTVEEVVGVSVEYNITSRRPGDPAILCASNERARMLLSWEPIHSSLHQMVDDAYRFMISVSDAKQVCSASVKSLGKQLSNE